MICMHSPTNESERLQHSDFSKAPNTLLGGAQAWGPGMGCGHGVRAWGAGWGVGLCGPRATGHGPMRVSHPGVLAHVLRCPAPCGMRRGSPPHLCTHQASGLWPTHTGSSVWRVCTNMLPYARSRALLCPAYTGYCHAFVPGSHQGSVIKASSGSSIVYIPTMYHHHHHQ